MTIVLVSLSLFQLPISYANTANKLAFENLSSQHQCNKQFKYSIHLFNDEVGYLQRTINWHNDMDTSKATVTSFAEVSFLWLDSTYQQQATMEYSSIYKHFLTHSFSQKLTGIKTREMSATLSDSGLSSTVTLNNKVSKFQQSDNANMKGIPLYDIDTLGAQIRLNLLQGKTRFTLSRQASKKIETYQFKVAGDEVINHIKWGPQQVTKVVEIGKHGKMVLWFSAKHDHQLIKAQLDMIFSPLVWLSEFSKQC